MIKDRLNQIHNVVSPFRIELYCFLYFLATYMINLPLKQLIFDKICLNDYRLAVDSCDSLGNTYGQSKVNNQIQSTLTQLTLYQHSLSTLPSIILTFLLGHWIDTRLDHLRYILALPCIGGAILNIFLTVQCINFNTEPMDTIYPFLFTGISGGETLAITGAYAFICKTTQSKNRPLRFIILEAVSSLASPLANFLSDKLLSQTPWIYGQYRNYIGVFLVSGSILTFTEFWILITLLTGQSNASSSSTGQSRRQSRKVSQVSAYSYYKSLRDANSRRVTAFSLQVPGPSNRRESAISHHHHTIGYGRRTSVATLLMGFSMMNKPPSNGQRHSMGTLSEDGLDTRRASAISNSKRNSTSSTDFTFLQVIHYKNVIMAFKSFIRPRNNYGRAQLICLTSSMIAVFFTINSSSIIDESYVKDLFDWTQLHFNQIIDVKIIVTSLASVIIMAILIRLLSLRDITITTIGLASILATLLLKGLISHQIGFYLSSTIEILFGLTLAGFRSMVTSIVYSYEIAKIFTIMASFMTLTRPLVILIYVKLLSSTLHSKSNYLYLCFCLVLIFPMITIVFIYYIQKRYANQQSQQRKSFCTVQVTPSPLPGPSTNVFELSIAKENVRRKSSRF